MGFPALMERRRPIRKASAFVSPTILALLLIAVATAIPASAQFKTLLILPKTDGRPNAPLIQGLDGNLYGTTYGGGTHSGGIAYNFTPAKALNTIYNFCAEANCADGQLNSVGLLLATDGNFYSATTQGGNVAGPCIATGCGTLYKLTPAGALTTLYSFCSLANCADGKYSGALVEGTDGNFYGTTSIGGSGAACTGINGCGTVFKITPQGVFTTLYNSCSLTNCADGSGQGAPLVQGADGSFYGVTGGGGAHNFGTVYKITPTGTLTVLYSFCSLTNCTDGAYPSNGLVLASDGNFYGATVEGGLSNEVCTSHNRPTCGTIYRITPAGTLTTIYNFCSLTNCADGSLVFGSFIQSTDGNLYGVTALPGTGNGTFFKLSLSGSFSLLRTFTTNSPEGSVVQATNGNLYGTTAGASNRGTIFEWLTRLKPFVETLPTSGAAGSAVTILGTNLTGATAVTFNGTPASFTVVSATEIAATVPTGATTGTLKVTTPKGTLSSNVVFTIP